MHSEDALAEMLGEECVRAATSGQEAYSHDVDEVVDGEYEGEFSTFSLLEDVGVGEVHITRLAHSPPVGGHHLTRHPLPTTSPTAKTARKRAV
jgi:hypothetical protein